MNSLISRGYFNVSRTIVRTMVRIITTCLLCLGALRLCAGDASDRAGPQDPALRRELLRRTKTDQDARITLVKWMARQGLKNGANMDQLSEQQRAEFKKLAATANKADEENTTWLKQVVDDCGWPTRTLVGNDGASAAWLLVQHADADPKFQRKCLDLMVALPKNEVSQTDIAYLTDRVLLAEGKKQIYGTQCSMVEGKLVPRPLEDKANVDKLRKEVGLPPLAEYIKSSERIYTGKSN